MNVTVVGDRIVFLEYLKQLKKHKRDADRSKALWNGTTPVLSLAYHRNCGAFCFHVSCVVSLYLYSAHSHTHHTHLARTHTPHHTRTQLCCPCCIPTVEWRVTGQGIRWRKNRAALNCCGDIETQFIDYRFLKDLELRKEPKCLCCCVGTELLVYADDKDTVR